MWESARPRPERGAMGRWLIQNFLLSQRREENHVSLLATDPERGSAEASPCPHISFHRNVNCFSSTTIHLHLTQILQFKTNLHPTSNPKPPATIKFLQVSNTKMTSPTRLSRLLTFLNRPASSTSLPLFTKTVFKIEAISLIGTLVYTLAKARTGELRDKGGRPNMGVFVREAIEEGRDRLRGRSESCEYLFPK